MLEREHGKPEAVVIGFEEWKRLSNVQSFSWLSTSAPLAPDDLPERAHAPIRDVGL